MGIDDYFQRLQFRSIPYGDFGGPTPGTLDSALKKLVESNTPRGPGLRSLNLGGYDKVRTLSAGIESERRAQSFGASLWRRGGAGRDAGTLKSLSSDSSGVEVEMLEGILSDVYNGKVVVTKISPVANARKPVKEVRFLLGDKLSKAWVFKADPEKTAQELNAYWVAHDAGIPTGRPLGYAPQNAPYGFDVALLGGVIEHAGEGYETLLRNLTLQPGIAFQTAQAIARLLGDAHQKLTLADSRLKSYGVHVGTASPRQELEQRTLPVAAAAYGYDGRQLIEICEELHQRVDSFRVISHGDIHTRNIVTVARYDDGTHQFSESVKDFGIIDWEDLCWDHPLSDLADFWVHHERSARNVFGNSYPYTFSDMVREYQDATSREFPPAEAKVQLMLWHLYELMDPARKGLVDARGKFTYHRDMLERSLDSLHGDYPSEMRGLQAELRTLESGFLQH